MSSGREAENPKMRSGAEENMANGDQITAYLDELRRRLAGGAVRNSREQVAQIVAEAENHLREAAAASVVTGMSGQAAQGAAIAAFGQAQTVARAHRPRAAAVLAKLATAACPLLAAYLLVAAAIGDLVVYWETRTTSPAADGFLLGGPRGNASIVVSGPASAFPVRQVAPSIVVCAIAGLVVFVGYLIARRRGRPRGGTARAVRLPGFFFPAAAVGMVLLGAVEHKAVLPRLTRIIWIEQLPGSHELGIGAVLAAVVTALACGAWSAILLTRWTINRLTHRPSATVSA